LSGFPVLGAGIGGRHVAGTAKTIVVGMKAPKQHRAYKINFHLTLEFVQTIHSINLIGIFLKRANWLKSYFRIVRSLL
jgi:hypothetical protein